MTRTPHRLIFLAVLVCACGDDRDRPPDDGGGGQQYTPPKPVQASLTHTAAAPLAAGAGDFAFVSSSRGVAATKTGLIALEMTGASLGEMPSGFSEWALTSTGAGPAVSAIAIAPPGAIDGGDWAFFLPSGRAQAGALKVQMGPVPGTLAGEGVLASDLGSMFPSAIAAPQTGPGADALFIVDAVFGPGSAVRAYPYASWGGSSPRLEEENARRFTPDAGDVDGDGTDDATTLGRIDFGDSGRVGLVSFSFLAPAPPGAAGGVFAFDPVTGDALGRIIMPVTSSVTGALEFVGSVRATRDHVIVISAQKGPSFEDLGGRVAVYRVASWSPFRVVDVDAAAPYDQPESLVATSTPNPVGLAVTGVTALVVDAPFFADCALDVIDLSKTPAVLAQSLELGQLYTEGFAVPSDPRVSPDGSQAVIASEAGLIRATLAAAP